MLFSTQPAPSTQRPKPKKKLITKVFLGDSRTSSLHKPAKKIGLRYHKSNGSKQRTKSPPITVAVNDFMITIKASYQ
jgi:hypothetical protein